METFPTISPDQLSDSDLLRGRDQVLHQMRWARHYTRQLLDSIPLDLWYHQPSGATTHVAWQVGHLAVSQYGLMLFRQRGRAAGDLEVMPGWLRKQFGRGTVPASTAQGQPSPEELLARLAAIEAQVLAELPSCTAESLREPIDMPYAAYPIKLGALLFCPLHEALHAGQIGLLRRLLGLDPLR
ncbi:MAG: DinB family protein [Aureliella sp.]